MSNENEVVEDGFTAAQEQLLDEAANGKEASPVVEDKVEEPSIEELRQQLADEKKAREEAEEKASHAEEASKKSVSAEVRELETRLILAEERLNKDKEDASSQIVSIKAKLKEAKDNGDTELETELSDQLFDAKINKAKIEDNEIGLKNYRSEFDRRREAMEKAPVESSDYLTDEGLADYSKPAQEWIKKNPEFRNSADMRARAFKAHSGAVYRGIKLDTQEYFEFVEHELGMRDDDTEVEDASDASVEKQEQKKTVPLKRPVTAAPPSRLSSTTETKKNNGKYSLTAAEMEAAEISGMSPDEYRISKYGN